MRLSNYIFAMLQKFYFLAEFDQEMNFLQSYKDICGLNSKTNFVNKRIDKVDELQLL